LQSRRFAAIAHGKHVYVSVAVKIDTAKVGRIDNIARPAYGKELYIMSNKSSDLL
jgi:hypothetical protein